METIQVPKEKAEALKQLAALSPKALQILGNKMKGATPQRIQDIERKIESMHFMI